MIFIQPNLIMFTPTSPLFSLPTPSLLRSPTLSLGGGERHYKSRCSGLLALPISLLALLRCFLGLRYRYIVLQM